MEKLAKFLENSIITNELSIKLIPYAHAKLYIFTNKNHENSIFIGSSNFTQNGLIKTTRELNCYLKDKNICDEAKKWFDKNWSCNLSRDITLELYTFILDKIPEQYQIECEIEYEINGYYEDYREYYSDIEIVDYR
ncbi:MAG: NgoFVII family restriction endonuclease [Aphanizomenon gracile PMC644.10]|nr:NgoFVII family restriction endonuclease [Aphanizomenon gracile PMC644.10]